LSVSGGPSFSVPAISIHKWAGLEVPGKFTTREEVKSLNNSTPPTPHRSTPRRLTIADDGSSRKKVLQERKVNLLDTSEHRKSILLETLDPRKGNFLDTMDHHNASPTKTVKGRTGHHNKEKEESRESFLKRLKRSSRCVKHKINNPPPAGFTSLLPVPPSLQALPEELRNSIEIFASPDFSQQYLRQQKTLFNKKISLEKSLEFSKQPIKESILLSCDELNKQAIEMFKGCLEYMGERKSLIVKDQNELACSILKMAVDHPQLRDELYVQLVKQTTSNPQEKSEEKAWELFSMLLELCIIPSHLFEKFVRQHFQSTAEKSPYLGIKKITSYCSKRLNHLLAKPRNPMLPIPALLSYARDIPFIPSVFRNKLPQIMELQTHTHPDLSIPLILQTIIHLIISEGGLTSTGIFRVAAKVSDVSALRLRLETSRGAPFPTEEPSDPNIPACLLKLWLSEIDEPLVPRESYSTVIQHCKDWETLEITISEFPESNRHCLYYIINFLQLVIKEDNKMNAQNIAIVMSPTLCRSPIESDNIDNLVRKTSIEAEFCCTLLNNMPCVYPIFFK